MTGPFPSPEVRRLSKEIGKLQGQIVELQGGMSTASAGRSSLDGQVWLVKDADGVVRQIVGQQSDGAYTTTDLNAGAPPTPADPVVQAVPGGLKVSWSGAFAGGAVRPTDFAYVELHVDLNPTFTPTDETEDAAITGRGSITFATNSYDPHTVRLVSRNTSGKRSAPTGAFTVTPGLLGPGDIAPGGVGTVALDDGAVTPPKSGTGVTANLVPDPGFNELGWRIKRTVAPWGFVDAASVGFAGADWAAYCPATLSRATLSATGSGDIPVIPGESYFIAYDAARSAAGAGLFWVEVTYYNSAGVLVTPNDDALDPLLTEIRAIGSLPATEFETRHGQITVPPNTANMRVVLVRDDEVGTSSGNLYIDRMEVRSVISRASTGDRVETSATGLFVYDTTGTPIGSINPDGSISMLSGSFDSSITYQGTELGALLDKRARGEIARADVGFDSSPNTTSEVEWVELDWAAEAGRAYKLRSSGLVNKTSGVHGIQVRWTTDNTRPLITSPIFTSTSSVQNGTLYLASDLGWTDTVARSVKMLLCVKSFDGSAGYFDPADLGSGFSVWVEDVGPRAEPQGAVVTPPGTAIGGGTVVAPAPQPVLQTFTTAWNCTWSQAWNVHGIRQNGGLMWQGYYGGSGGDYNGDNAGLFGFDMTDVRAKLAGATISKLEIYLYSEHWYYNSGGNVWLGTTNVTSPPGSYPGTTTQRFSWHLNKPQGKWVDLGGVGVTIGNEIRDGSTGAFVLDPRPFARNLLDYGRFVGSGGGVGSTAPGLRITYTKAV